MEQYLSLILLGVVGLLAVVAGVLLRVRGNKARKARAAKAAKGNGKAARAGKRKGGADAPPRDIDGQSGLPPDDGGDGEFRDGGLFASRTRKKKKQEYFQDWN